MDAWLYFPGLKVGQINFIFPFWLLSGVYYKSLESRPTIIYEPCSWLKLFSLALFVFPSQGSLNSSRVERLLQIRPVFVTSQLCLLLNNQIQTFLNLKHLNETCEQFFPTKRVLPPHWHFLAWNYLKLIETIWLRINSILSNARKWQRWEIQSRLQYQMCSNDFPQLLWMKHEVVFGASATSFFISGKKLRHTNSVSH